MAATRVKREKRAREYEKRRNASFQQGRGQKCSSRGGDAIPAVPPSGALDSQAGSKRPLTIDATPTSSM